MTWFWEIPDSKPVIGLIKCDIKYARLLKLVSSSWQNTNWQNYLLSKCEICMFAKFLYMNVCLWVCSLFISKLYSDRDEALGIYCANIGEGFWPKMLTRDRGRRPIQRWSAYRGSSPLGGKALFRSGPPIFQKSTRNTDPRETPSQPYEAGLGQLVFNKKQNVPKWYCVFFKQTKEK